MAGVTRPCSCADRGALAAACIAGLMGEWALIKRSLSSPAKFGATLGGIGTVIGMLGVMMGRLLGFRRGGAYRTGFIKWLETRREEEWALAISRFILSASPFFVVRFCHSTSGGESAGTAVAVRY